MSYECSQRSYEQRIKMRKLNFQPEERGEIEQKPKTSQIKTIQKFINRLKGDAKNGEALLLEMSGLNLSKYLQEIAFIIANSVCEKDISLYTEVGIAQCRSQPV